MLSEELFSQVRKLEIRTGRVVDELMGGAYHSVFKGRGMEFDEVRDYQEGDDVRAIDWNVTARLGHPFIKKFVEERELTVMLLVDVSASGDFGSGARSKNEHAAELAALLAFSAIRNNDRVGLQLFSDFDELYVAPRKGRRHVLRLLRDLLAHEQRHRQTNIKAALEHCMRANHRRSVVFLISDFIDTDYKQALAIANRRHDLVALRVLDPAELAAPSGGFVTVEDAETGEQDTVPAGLQLWRSGHDAANATRHQQAALFCRQAGVDMVDFRVGEDSVRPLMRFFRQRGRRR